jgi:Flp pilus assembly pilin Flp
MTKLANIARSFVRDEQGATTAEYGVIVAVMVAIAVAVMITLKGGLNTLYTQTNTSMSGAAAAVSGS